MAIYPFSKKRSLLTYLVHAFGPIGRGNDTGLWTEALHIILFVETDRLT